AARGAGRGGAHRVPPWVGPGRGAGRGRRPSRSRARSTGVRSMTVLKLTVSLARFSATTRASMPSRAGGAVERAAAVPTAAPSTLAPASPSMPCSRRSGGRATSAGSSAARPRCVPVAARALPAAAGAARSAAAGKGGGGRKDVLQGPPRPQVQQVGEVRAACGQGGVGQYHRPTSRRGGGGRPRQGQQWDAGRLERPGGQPTATQRPEVSAQPLGDGPASAAHMRLEQIVEQSQGSDAGQDGSVG